MVTFFSDMMFLLSYFLSLNQEAFFSADFGNDGGLLLHKKECAIGTFFRRGAVALATIYHCAECDNNFYVIGDSIGISYCIKN